MGAISRVVRCGPGRAGRHFACGAERCGAAAAAISRVVRCGARPPFRERSAPRCSPPAEARVKVMARFSPDCAVVLLEHLDTPVTRFLLSLPPLSRLFEAQVSPRRAPHCLHLTDTHLGGAAPPPKQASCGVRGASTCGAAPLGMPVIVLSVPSSTEHASVWLHMCLLNLFFCSSIEKGRV